MRVLLLVVSCLIMAIDVHAEPSFTGFRQQFLSVDKSDVCKLVFRNNLNKEGKLYFSFSLIDEGSSPIKHDTEMLFDIIFYSNEGKTYSLEKQNFKNDPYAKLSDSKLMALENKAKQTNVNGGHFIPVGAEFDNNEQSNYVPAHIDDSEPIVINPGGSIASGQLIDDEQIIKLIQSGQIKGIKVKIYEMDGVKDYSFN